MDHLSITERAERTGKRIVREDRYALVLVLILATLVSSAMLGTTTLGLVLPLALMALTLAVTLSTSEAGPKTVLVARIAVAIAFVGVVVAELLSFGGLARLGFFLCMATLSIVTPIVIVRRLLKHAAVTVNTVAGAADIYLLIGVFFAVVYSAVGAIQAGMYDALGQAGAAISPATAFFVASRPVTGSDFIYYSLVTLSTVGYGDLTATTSFGRLLSTTEALLGQLYLVTVVAVLVANIGRVRRDAHPSDDR